MSSRERVHAMIDEMPDYTIEGLLAFLCSLEDVPNAETREAMREVDEIISSGAGDAFSGSTAEFLRQIAA